MSNPLLKIIDGGLDHPVHKWVHYLPLYDKYFSKYKSRGNSENKIKILEIGIFKGGSLDLWNKYFGKENCEIYGLDINPECKKFEKENIKIFIGDQSDKLFLENLKNNIPPIDILIDDGGHTMVQQINTFEVLFPYVKSGGMYLCEDTHTSYWKDYGGEIYNPSTFIEYSKKLIDKINGYHCQNVDYVTQNCQGIYYHDSMVFFEKSENIITAPIDKLWQFN